MSRGYWKALERPLEGPIKVLMKNIGMVRISGKSHELERDTMVEPWCTHCGKERDVVVEITMALTLCNGCLEYLARVTEVATLARDAMRDL